MEFKPLVPNEEISFEAHPPERQSQKGVVLACGGCSCCCCCCGHSIGSLTGAIYGSVAFTEDDLVSYGTIWLYWGMVILTAGLIFLGALGQGDIEIGMWGVLLGLPAIQLITSVILLVGGTIFILPFKGVTPLFSTLWRITKFTLLGTIIGILAMVALYGVTSTTGMF